MSNGCVIWLTGISGSGKSTIAKLLKQKLDPEVSDLHLLDGDEIRDFFEDDLGYTRKERVMNVRRVAFAASMLAEHGVLVIVANIAPYYEVRDFIRRKVNNYIQVYVKASLEEVRRRDVKGFYRKYEKGEIKDIIGIDDEYEEPRFPNLIVNTMKEDPEKSTQKILEMLMKKRII